MATTRRTLQIHRPRLVLNHSMRKEVTIIGLGLILLHLFTEAHSILAVCKQSLAETAIDLFISPTYKMLLTIQWYLKMNFDSLLVIGTYYLLAWVSAKYSKRLFYIACVWFFYHCIDCYLFWWNYKSTYSVYWALGAVMTLQTVVLLIPIKEKAKVVCLQ